MKETVSQRLQDRPSSHLFGTGTVMCTGCGGLQALHEIYDRLGDNSVFVNTTDCISLQSGSPFSPFRGAWLYTPMASTPAAAEGIRTALDILKQQDKLSEDWNPQVVIQTGDNAAYGMGLSATSAAIEHHLDFLYICYDTDSYNASTRCRHPYPGYKKDLFAIWAAHKPVFAATAIAADPLDLARKLEKAKALTGPRCMMILAPCPRCWGFDPKDTPAISQLAIATGVWPLKEFVDGRVVHTRTPQKREPVESYLKLQGRFRHLFEPIRNDRLIAEIQSRIDRYWQQAGDE